MSVRAELPPSAGDRMIQILSASLTDANVRAAANQAYAEHVEGLLAKTQERIQELEEALYGRNMNDSPVAT